MKTTLTVLAVVALLGVAREAAACSLCTGGLGPSGPIDFTPPRDARMVTSALTIGATAAVMAGSGFVLAEGKLSRRWYAASLAMGLVNVAVAALYALVLTDEKEPQRINIALIHAAVGVSAVALPIAGLISVAPTVVGGRGWTGAGVRVSF